MNAQALATRAADIKARIRILTNERTTLAPIAINGDARGPDARARIAAIDAERSKLILDLETYEAALASPEYRFGHQTARLDAIYFGGTVQGGPWHGNVYAGKKAEFQRRLVVELNRQYLVLSERDNFVRSGGLGGAEKAHALLLDLPRAIAAQFTRESMVREDLAGVKHSAASMGTFGRGSHQEHDNAPKIARLEAELAALTRHTADLTATTELPPIPDALKALLTRLGLDAAREEANTNAINEATNKAPPRV